MDWANPSQNFEKCPSPNQSNHTVIHRTVHVTAKLRCDSMMIMAKSHHVVQ